MPIPHQTRRVRLSTALHFPLLGTCKLLHGPVKLRQERLLLGSWLASPVPQYAQIEMLGRGIRRA